MSVSASSVDVEFSKQWLCCILYSWEHGWSTTWAAIMYAASKDLYIMQIHVNSRYESDGLSSVAMLICMCLKLISNFFGLYGEKFCYHALSCLYEYFLISYSVSRTTLLQFDNSFVFMWLKVVANACAVSFNRNLTLECWSLEFVSLKKNCIFPGRVLEFCIKIVWPPCLI